MAYPKPGLSAEERIALYNTLQPLGWTMDWITEGVKVAEWVGNLSIPDLYALIKTLEPRGWTAVVEYAKYVVYSKEKMNQMLPWIVGGIGAATLIGLQVGKRQSD